MKGVDPRDLADALMDRPAFVRRYKPSLTVNWMRFMVGAIYHKPGDQRATEGMAGVSVAVGPVLLNLLWTDREAHEANVASAKDVAMKSLAENAALAGAAKSMVGPVMSGGKVADRITIRRPPPFVSGVKTPMGD